MKIYRLENRQGSGVYSVLLDSGTQEDYYGGKNTRHPGPRNDSLFCENHVTKLGALVGGRDFSGKYVFGFNSPAQVLRWFFNREDLALLESQSGIQISVYDCDDVIEGNTQVAFGIWHHTLFTPVKTYGLTEFYDQFAGKFSGTTANRAQQSDD